MNVDGILTNMILRQLGGTAPAEVPPKAPLSIFSFFEGYTLLILLIMVLAGAIGGLAGYFLCRRGAKDENFSLVASPIIGVTASLIVPLALNVFSSETLARGEKDPLGLLVFAGICIVAALAAVRLSYQRPEAAVEQILSVREAVGRIEADLCEPDLSELKPSEAEAVPGDLKGDDYRILEALAQGRFLFRSLSGLTVDAGLGRDILGRRLPLLARQGYVRQRLTEEGSVRWALSPKGRLTVNQWLLLRTRDDGR